LLRKLKRGRGGEQNISQKKQGNTKSHWERDVQLKWTSAQRERGGGVWAKEKQDMEEQEAIAKNYGLQTKKGRPQSFQLQRKGKD